MAKTIGILVEQDYQDLEVWYPILRLKEAGHKVVVIGTGAETYESKHGYPVQADASAARVSAADLDALVIPGGWAPDYLRRHEAVVNLVRDVYKAGKPTAAICHAGSLLVSAGILKGRTVTSFFAIRADMEAAGAKWVDREVQVDANLITARKPDDLPAFCRELLKALEKPAAKTAAATR
jgi:protease I